MSPKNYSIIIAPSDGSRSYHLQVSRRTVAVSGAALFVILAVLVFFVATYGSLARKMRRWEDLETRCAVLEQEAARVGALEEELERLREMDRRVRSLMGLPEPAAKPEGADGEAAATGDSASGVEAVDLPDAMVPDEPIRAGLEEKLRSRKNALRWPVDGFVSSSFGEARAEGGVHAGIDIAAPRNTSVEVPLGGKVIDAGRHPVYGNVAVVEHGNGLVTVYGHNARILVREGQRLREGDTLALVGNTGQSSAPHLHFEVRKDGYAVDPLFLLKKKGRS
jgi:murein DD-endopeptidase MepM/ murein hydrolase activator NlpD